MTRSEFLLTTNKRWHLFYLALHLATFLTTFAYCSLLARFAMTKLFSLQKLVITWQHEERFCLAGNPFFLQTERSGQSSRHQWEYPVKSSNAGSAGSRPRSESPSWLQQHLGKLCPPVASRKCSRLAQGPKSKYFKMGLTRHDFANLNLD